MTAPVPPALPRDEEHPNGWPVGFVSQALRSTNDAEGLDVLDKCGLYDPEAHTEAGFSQQNPMSQSGFAQQSLRVLLNVLGLGQYADRLESRGWVDVDTMEQMSKLALERVLETVQKCVDTTSRAFPMRSLKEGVAS